jgi:hypothetical protein
MSGVGALVAIDGMVERHKVSASASAGRKFFGAHAELNG